jgi:deoxyribodipyrimidine photo-lyase
MPVSIAIVLFRRDLRLADNPALDYAAQTCDAIVPLYLWNPDELAPWAPGAAARYWLHQSLDALDRSLRQRNSKLILAEGDPAKTLLDLAKVTGASLICWNRRYEPRALVADAQLADALAGHGIETKSFNASLLVEPWEVLTKAAKPFRVFTPFWKACLNTMTIAPPVSAPPAIPAPKAWPPSIALEALRLKPKLGWADGIRAAWRFGEEGGEAALERFWDGPLRDYRDGRDSLGEFGTSRLSPYLAAGQLSPRQVWHAVQQRTASEPGLEDGSEAFLRQLFWREFGYHLLYHEPQTPEAPLRGEFERFPWREDREALERWQRGETGFPIVDAAMRELRLTGYMHNRARMVVASFLVKDLMIPWQHGARWFWDTLVDADLANNTLGWQWTAGCGADAAPFFRVLNPVRQGERFDAEGAYVRRWVPEVAKLPNQHIHSPWQAPDDVLARAQVGLGASYPGPMIDHAEARQAALAAFQTIRR